MKITFKDTKFVEFGQLHNGSTFIDPEYDEGTVLMRVDTCVDVDLITDTDVSEEFNGYAVDIQTGYIMGFYNSDKVIPVEAEVTVQK